jgi:adenosylcobinamide-phosphate synthase (EC 6.3.1.10)
MITLGSIAVITAIGLDTIIREPPAFAHPVALFGRIIDLIDQSYANPTIVGILITATFPVGFAATTAAIVSVALGVNSRLGAVTAGCILFTLVSLRLLLTTVHDVVIMSTVDLSAARHDLRALAGREASELDAAHIRSAAVESAAENLADGFIGPLLAFTMCAPVSISGGVAGAAWVKAINTLDSMLGYHSNPLGTAPARVDDIVMWVPARLTAALLSIAVGQPFLPLQQQVRADAAQTTSPNAGWPMATMAALLPARLHKLDTYELQASASLPNKSMATAAVQVTRRAGMIAIVITVIALEVVQ